MYNVDKSESRIFCEWINLKCKKLIGIRIHTSIYHTVYFKKNEKLKKSWKLCKSKIGQCLRPKVWLTNIRHGMQNYIDKAIISESFK